jgi:hypothetical protein
MGIYKHSVIDTEYELAASSSFAVNLTTFNFREPHEGRRWFSLNTELIANQLAVSHSAIRGPRPRASVTHFFALAHVLTN